MQALILVGGEGTRLRPLTSEIPKPAIQLVDRPLLAYMIEWLGRHGVGEIVLACGFRPERIRSVLGEGGGAGPRLRYVEEPEPLGTAGAIKFADEHLEERFLALNGDTLTDLDLTALVRAHEDHGATATLGLYPVEDASAYGLVRTDKSGAITEFVEKPSADQAGPGEINAGAYVLEGRVLERIPAGRKVSIEREVFPAMVGQGLYGLRLEGYWMDIGTPDRYLAASWDILEGRVETAVAGRLGGEARLVEEGARVAERARLGEAVLVEAGAEIGVEARVGPRAVVAAGARVGARAGVTGSVLQPGSTVGEEAVLKDCILAPGARVGAGAEPQPGTVVGAGAA